MHEVDKLAGYMENVQHACNTRQTSVLGHINLIVSHPKNWREGEAFIFVYNHGDRILIVIIGGGGKIDHLP